MKRPRATPVTPRAPTAINARALKRLARAHAATVPLRLLAQIDQFASMADWTVVPSVQVKSGWQPSARFLVVDGDLTAGKILVRDGVSDFGVVIVLGDVTCGSFEVASGWTFVCTGAVDAKRTITATAADSASYVGGKVKAKLVKSGNGAWLTLFGGAASLDAPVSHSVMVDGVGPLKARPPRTG